MRVAGKEAAREAQNRGRGYCRVAGLARSGPGVALASLMSIFAQDLDPGLRPGRVASRCWTVFSLRVRRTRIADPDVARAWTQVHRLRHVPDLGLATG